VASTAEVNVDDTVGKRPVEEHTLKMAHVDKLTSKIVCIPQQPPSHSEHSPPTRSIFPRSVGLVSPSSNPLSPWLLLGDSRPAIFTR
jgi:hypothetical protein